MRRPTAPEKVASVMRFFTRPALRPCPVRAQDDDAADQQAARSASAAPASTAAGHVGHLAGEVT
jgi:hypothetical protein